MLSRDIFEQLCNDLKKASNSVWLWINLMMLRHRKKKIFIRFETNENFNEELVTLLPLKKTTKSEDIYRALKSC
jgi:hypothetical protein